MRLRILLAMLLSFPGGGVIVEPGKQYTLRISSDVSDVQHAFGFRLDHDGAVWNRATYLILSEAGRKLFFACISVLLVLLVFWLVQKKESFLKPENLFLLLSCILCPLYLMGIPIFQVPDEVNHYVRAYGIVHGYFLSPEGGNMPIPDNLIPYEWYTYTPYILFKNFSMEINPANSILHNNVNMALYSPVSYIFQVLGIGAADLFSDNTYVLALSGSLVNMAGCTALIYYAIKFIPYGKGVLAFISLLPMALQERASLSVDAITYAALAAMLAFCLYMRQNRVKMSGREIALMYLFTALTASCKVVYFPLAFLLVLIPDENFGNKKRGLLLKGVGILETLALSAGWLLIAKNYLGDTRAGGDAAEKLGFIFHSPGRFIYILFKTFWKNEEGLVWEMLGSKLGSLNIIINAMLLLLILILFFKVYYKEKLRREAPDYLAEAALLFLSLGMILLIAVSLYLQWTDIGASTYSIEGLQGRYFLPVLPVICCGFLSTKAKRQAGSDTECRSGLLGLYVVNLLVLIDVISHSSYVG